MAGADTPGQWIVIFVGRAVRRILLGAVLDPLVVLVEHAVDFVRLFRIPLFQDIAVNPDLADDEPRVGAVRQPVVGIDEHLLPRDMADKHLTRHNLADLPVLLALQVDEKPAPPADDAVAERFGFKEIGAGLVPHLLQQRGQDVADFNVIGVPPHHLKVGTLLDLKTQHHVDRGPDQVQDRRLLTAIDQGFFFIRSPLIAVVEIEIALIALAPVPLEVFSIHQPAVKFMIEYPVVHVFSPLPFTRLHPSKGIVPGPACPACPTGPPCHITVNDSSRRFRVFLPFRDDGSVIAPARSKSCSSVIRNASARFGERKPRFFKSSLDSTTTLPPL